ncbi:hypothetical protein KEJ51_06110, partial [Candidatus Bathyarchaeota archaeon]|nr:hypothetical protein [Candidatus Bathyarchaeota archaeon]
PRSKPNPPHQTSSSNPSTIFIIGCGLQDIYGYDRRLEKARKGLEASNSILEDNRKSIMGFIEHILAQGVSKARAAKYIYHLTVLARVAEKPFSLFTRKDVERLR